jgi:hypothetical protein
MKYRFGDMENSNLIAKRPECGLKYSGNCFYVCKRSTTAEAASHGLFSFGDLITREDEAGTIGTEAPP